MSEYDSIASELVNVDHQSGIIKTVTGRHPAYGETILLRDATRCLVVVEDPTLLDIAGTQTTLFESGLR